MWIEFLGSVGSGKSSLAAALKERLRLAGHSANSPLEALDIRLAQSPPPASLHGHTKQIARRILLAGWQTRFFLKHPRLVWQAWSASQKLRDLPGWHRRIIRSLFYEVAGWYEGLSRAALPGSIVLVDEGLSHRSINLFAWQTGDLHIEALQAYLESLPEIPLTILVSAPVQVCLERAYSRGLPARLRGKDPHTIRRFIESSHRVASLAGEILTSNGRSVLQVDNSSGFEKALTSLCNQVEATPFFQKYSTQPYQMSLS